MGEPELELATPSARTVAPPARGVLPTRDRRSARLRPLRSAAPGEHPTLETHIDDLVAVAEDSNVGRPALFGQNETGFMCLLAAATRPDLFGSLILYGASPCFAKTDDMPWELPSERIESDIRSVRRLASNREWAESFARGDSKTLRTDRAALAWFTGAQEMATTPQGWAAAMEVIHRTDLRSVLPSIGVPTLVLHRVHDQREPIESARYLAEKTPTPGSSSSTAMRLCRSSETRTRCSTRSRSS